jgi:hypothetical protein
LISPIILGALHLSFWYRYTKRLNCQLNASLNCLATGLFHFHKPCLLFLKISVTQFPISYRHLHLTPACIFQRSGKCGMEGSFIYNSKRFVTCGAFPRLSFSHWHHYSTHTHTHTHTCRVWNLFIE